MTGLYYILGTQVATVNDVASATDCQYECVRNAQCSVFNFFPKECKCVLGSGEKAR